MLRSTALGNLADFLSIISTIALLVYVIATVSILMLGLVNTAILGGIFVIISLVARIMSLKNRCTQCL